MHSVIRWLRWGLMLPCALVASLVVGAAINWIVSARLNAFTGSTSSGAFSAVAFIVAGLTVAPRQTLAVQRVLAAVGLCLGVVALLAAVVVRDGLNVASASAMCVFCAVGCVVPIWGGDAHTPAP